MKQRHSTSRKTVDETCANGVVIRWSQRDGSLIPVTLACGHPTHPREVVCLRNLRIGSGLCRSCTATLRYGPNGGGWKGGRVSSGIKGYVRIRVSALSAAEANLAQMADKTGYIYEHRLVMARHLGRALVPGEIVHHLNGVTDDNCLENLELVTPNTHGLANKVVVIRLQAEVARLQSRVAELEEALLLSEVPHASVSARHTACRTPAGGPGPARLVSPVRP